MGKWKPRPRPCPSCPYRHDVASGIWDASCYAALPGYDHDVPEQAAAGATRLFMCHLRAGELCAGWVGCHDMRNNLAVRLHSRDVDPAVYGYVSPVPLFSSGAEAAAHGMRDYENPGGRARQTVERLLRLPGVRRGPAGGRR